MEKAEIHFILEEFFNGLLGIADIVHVEQLHSLKGNPKTYSFSIRTVFSADGWMVPLFIRGFAAKVDGSYRFLFLAAPDSERDMVERAGLDLIRRPMMKEVKK